MMSGQEHALAAHYPWGKDPSTVPTGQEAGQAPQSVLMERPEEKSFALAGNELQPSSPLAVTILTELPQLITY
jgi:hypothetical protein